MPVSFAEQHADLAAFLWHRRDAAVRAPHHDLATLSDLDERIEANLDGLRVAGEKGLEVAEAAVDDEDPGTVFVAFAVALDRGDRRAMAGLFDRAAEDHDLARGLVTALAWEPFEVTSPVLSALSSARAAPLRRIGMAAFAAHRKDPGPALLQALLHADGALRARALRAVGELGRTDLLGDTQAELGSSDEGCRFWAAWSLSLLGEAEAAKALSGFAFADGARAERAADLSARALPIAEARSLLTTLRVDHPRTAAIGALALGDPGDVPWLLSCMDVPELARVAADAFTAITGIEIARDLVGKCPEGFEAGPSDDPKDERVAMDPDGKLDWPAPAAVKRAWEAKAADLRVGARHLLGEPMTPARLAEVLRSGKQRQRAGAALELAMERRGAPLFEVRARGERQRALLGVRA